MSTIHDGAIGVFDSGVGGLSVLRAIRQALPCESLIYVADSAHAPYGDRDASFVHERSALIAGHLVDAGVRALVVACNTASVVAAEALRRLHAVPIVAIEPAIKPAVSRSRSGVIGVLATRRTIESAAVARLCAAHGRDARIVLQRCPGLVERIEAGDLDGPLVHGLAGRYVAPLLAAGADVLVLGCTHYTFIAPVLRALVPDHVELIDPATAVATQLVRRIGSSRSAMAAATTTFLSTADEPAQYSILARLWGEPIVVEPWPAVRCSA